MPPVRMRLPVRSFTLRAFVAALGLFVLGAAVWNTYISAPASFTPDTMVIIPEGSTGEHIAGLLVEESVIRSPFMFRAASRLFFDSTGFQAGLYLFEEPQSLFTVLERIASGRYGLDPVRITFVEGMTVRDMALRAAEIYPHIDPAIFRTLGEPYEGYLFPDTYEFLPTVSEEQIIAVMRENFAKQITVLEADVAASGHSLNEIVIMASLIEKEARTTQSRRMVSGILWERLAINMPLQVDAVFGYIYERDTFSPSFADLEIDSLYNTYRYPGLPPGAIANPGLDALSAALYPIESPYLYYLTGRDGNMYYAETFDGHRENRARYLD